MELDRFGSVELTSPKAHPLVPLVFVPLVPSKVNSNFRDNNFPFFYEMVTIFAEHDRIKICALILNFIYRLSGLLCFTYHEIMLVRRPWLLCCMLYIMCTYNSIFYCQLFFWRKLVLFIICKVCLLFLGKN